MSDLEARVKWLEGTLSLGQAGKQTVTIDRMASVGGTEAGFLGGELLLVSLGGCLTSNLVAAAKARNVTLVRLESHIVGTQAQNPTRLSGLEVEIDLAATDNTDGRELNDEELDKLVTIGERACLVANTLRSSLILNVHRVGSAVAIA